MVQKFSESDFTDTATEPPASTSKLTDSDFAGAPQKKTFTDEDFKSPVPSAREQYVKAAGQLIAHATISARNAAARPVTGILEKAGKEATDVTEKLKLPKVDSPGIVERLTKAAHDAAISFGIKPTEEEKVENPTITALGITRPLRAYQTLIDRALPEVTALEPWFALKEKPLTDKIDHWINKYRGLSKMEESAIAPVETSTKEIPKFNLALRTAAATANQITYGASKGLEAMLNPVDFLEAEAVGRAASGIAGVASEAIARNHPEAGLRAQLSPIEKMGESDLAHLTKAPEDLTRMDHIHRHVQGTTNSILEGVQERTGASPSVMKAAADELDRAGYAKVYRELNGLHPGDATPSESLRGLIAQTAEEPPLPPQMRSSSDVEGGAPIEPRPIPTAPNDIAVDVASAKVLNPDAAAVAKDYPSLYAVASGAEVPKSVGPKLEAFVSDLAQRGVKEGSVLDMLKEGLATGKASFVQMAKLNDALQEAALEAQGAHPDTVQRHKADAYTAAQRPGEAIVVHHMEVETQKNAVLARAKATAEVWEEAHRTIKESDKEAPAPTQEPELNHLTQSVKSEPEPAPPLPSRAEVIAHAEDAGVPAEEAADAHRAAALQEQESGTLDPDIAQEYAEAGDNSFDPAALEDEQSPFPNTAKHPAEMSWEEFKAEYPGMDKATHQLIVEEAQFEVEKAARAETKENLRSSGVTAQPIHDELRKTPIGEKWVKKLGLTGEFEAYKKSGILVKGGNDENKVDYALTRLKEVGALPADATINDMLDALDHESRMGTKKEAEESLVRDAPALDLSSIVPAVRTASGEVIAGNVGEHHQDLIDRMNDPAERAAAQKDKDSEGPSLGFVDKDGKFITRDQAEKKYGVRHSEELNVIRDGGIKDEAAKAYGPGVDLASISKEIQLDLDFGGEVNLPAKLAKDGKIDYRGLEIKGIQDLAEVIASRRNPQMEHNNFVLLRKGKVVSHMVWTSGLPNAVLVSDADKISVLEEADRLGADEIWTGHNHPSGMSDPSREDRILSTSVAHQFGDRYKGMVVTNGEEFHTVIHEKTALGMTKYEPVVSKHSFKNPQEKFPTASGPAVLSAKDAVAAAAKGGQLGKLPTVLLLDSRGRVLSLEHIQDHENIPSRTKEMILGRKASGAVIVAPYNRFLVSDVSKIPREVWDAVRVDENGEIIDNGFPKSGRGESVYGKITSTRVAERKPRYMGGHGMDANDFAQAIEKAKIEAGSPVTARVRFAGLDKGTKGKVLSVGQKTQTLMVQFEGETVPRAVRAENLVETNRKPAARVALETAQKAEKVGGEPSLSIKKIVQEQQAGLAAGNPSQLSELEALSLKFRSQAKGARIGAREATKVMKAKMDTALDAYREKVAGLKADLKYSKAEQKANLDWMTAYEDKIRSGLVEYIQDNLPVEARGKFLTMVKNADTVSKLGIGLERVDDAVAQLHKKGLLQDIRKLVERTLESPRVDVNAKKAIREYTSEVELKGRSDATYARLRKTLEFMAGQEGTGVDVGLPKAVVEELDILGRRPLKDMNEVELEGIFLRLQMLEEIGRTTVKTREALYLLERERVSAEILSDLKPIEARAITHQKDFKPLTTKENVQNEIKQKLNAAYDKYMAITPPDVVWDMLSKTPQYQGAMVKHFAHGIGADYARNIDLYDEPIKAARDLIKKHDLTDEQIQRVTAHAYVRQEGGVEYLKNQMLLSDEAIKSVTALTPAETELYKSWRSALDSIYPQLADSVRFNDNLEVGRRSEYFPVRFDPNRAIESGDDLARMIRGLHEGFQKNVQMGNLKRRERSNKAVALDGQRTFEHYMRVAAYKVAMSRRVRMLGEVVNSPEFREGAGDFGVRYAKQFVTMMARRGSPRQGEVIPWMDNARRNASVFSIVGRLPTAMVHLTLLTNAAAISGPGPVFGALRQVLGADLAKDSKYEDFWRENDPIYRQGHGDDPIFQDVASIASMKGADWWKFLTTPSSLRYIVQKSTLATLEGNYVQALKKRGLERDFTSKVNMDALNEARLLTRRAIASPELPHMFLAYNSGDVLTGNLSGNRALTQFHNFPLDRWSTYAHDLPAMVKSGRTGEAANFVFWNTVGDFVEVGIRHGYKAALALALGAGASASMDEDDRKFWGEFMMKILEKPPFVPDIINLGLYGRLPTTVADMGVDAVKKAFAAGKAYELADNRKALISMTDSLTDLASLFFKIPGGSTIQQVLRMVLSDGSVRFPFQDERTRLNNLHKNGNALPEELQDRVRMNHAYTHFEKLNHNYKQAMNEGRRDDAAQVLKAMSVIAHDVSTFVR